MLLKNVHEAVISFANANTELHENPLAGQSERAIGVDNRTLTQDPSSQKTALFKLKVINVGIEGATVVGIGELNVGDEFGR